MTIWGNVVDEVESFNFKYLGDLEQGWATSDICDRMDRYEEEV